MYEVLWFFTYSSKNAQFLHNFHTFLQLAPNLPLDNLILFLTTTFFLQRNITIFQRVVPFLALATSEILYLLFLCYLPFMFSFGFNFPSAIFFPVPCN